MSIRTLCNCPACASSRAVATAPIPAARDLATAIREQRNDTPEERHLRVVQALTPVAVVTDKE